MDQVLGWKPIKGIPARPVAGLAAQGNFEEL